MQKYSKAEIEIISYLLQRRDQLYEQHYVHSFESIVQQLKKEFDIQISRTTLSNYSRKIGVGQCHIKRPISELEKEESSDQFNPENLQNLFRIGPGFHEAIEQAILNYKNDGEVSEDVEEVEEVEEVQIPVKKFVQKKKINILEEEPADE
ncbi:Hypothetical_protein [Hexamita inflata]|uniref:Hypothetical_protein n=1 Tax=Hexamita inflata TaxID=28002 RepID=A0AA86P7K1_9EUKA|nr:Hypothetical protein HINF_LOCUS19901 [Hexamita inflata]